MGNSTTTGQFVTLAQGGVTFLSSQVTSTNPTDDVCPMIPINVPVGQILFPYAPLGELLSLKIIYYDSAGLDHRNWYDQFLVLQCAVDGEICWSDQFVLSDCYIYQMVSG